LEKDEEFKLMLSFIGIKSMSIISISCILGLLLATIEIVLATFIIEILAILGFGAGNGEPFSFIFSYLNQPYQVFIGLVFVTLIRSLLHIFKGYFAVSANESFVIRQRIMCLFASLEDKGPRQNPSTINSLISETFAKSALTFYGAAHLVPLTIQSLFILIFLVSISFELSIIGLSFLILVGFSGVVFQRHIFKTVNPLSKINEDLHKTIKHLLDNILVIKIFKLEKIEEAKIFKFLQDYLQRVKTGNLFALISENIPSVLGSVVLLFLFTIQVEKSFVDGETFIGFIYLFIRFTQIMSQVLNFTSIAVINFPFFLTAKNYIMKLPTAFRKDVDGLLYERNEAVLKPNAEMKNSKLLSEPPTVKIKKLSFEYLEGLPIFENLTFKIEPGDQCAILGPSGSGKSTLLNLLIGGLNPVSGEILINEQPPYSFINKYHPSISYAGPDPHLFDGTIRENLTYGLDTAISDGEIYEAINAINLNDWFQRSGGKLENNISETGIALSSGEAQRLSITRALLRKPKLLFFDEVTANLDKDTEDLICNILKKLKGKTTVIFVTHSKNVMTAANKSLEL
jgi:ABC-type multidrug transport system fused ATPase/permease subunit